MTQKTRKNRDFGDFRVFRGCGKCLISRPFEITGPPLIVGHFLAEKSQKIPLFEVENHHFFIHFREFPCFRPFSAIFPLFRVIGSEGSLILMSTRPVERVQKWENHCFSTARMWCPVGSENTKKWSLPKVASNPRGSCKSGKTRK